MAKPSNFRQAARGTIPYVAGEYLHKNGPQTSRDLFAAVHFGTKTTHKEDSLQAAIRSGWLTETLDGKIAVSQAAREHYDQEAGEAKVKPVGQIAAVRQPVNVFTQPPLNKRYIPNPRGMRQDIPEWSVRPAGFVFKSVAGGDA
ncbi:hypothetical protein [Massilia sp. DD77]|uniref:hypothetical protein n=1 Tax=Massilia sp. DD77 TaxID=3109349 RepID=UPI002FFFEA1E